ncbi:anti-sigma factor family protein [Sphingorhabdus sp.]|uniref:anti-sigma factor family protein n=1 Tax=Sphingorhabdus sp. TaxID=1902408 RepID=UPI003983B1D3
MTFDRASIAAYVDGELDLVSAKRLEKAMAEDAPLAKAVEAERMLRARLSAHFDPVAEEPVPDRLAALLLNNVSLLDEQRSKKTARWYRPSVMQWGAMAASLVVGLMIGGTALNRDAGYVRDNGGVLVASGELADALQTQLASTQGTDPKVRIGTSFAAKDSSYCRTFESASLDGIACRAGKDWQLKQTLSGNGTTSAYRQASAGALAEAAAAMMAGEAMDAAAEKAAAEKSWR